MNDPKFAWVARKAETNVATVIAVWAALLEHASQESERGSVGGFDPESYDCTLGLEDGTTQRVIDAMRGKGLLEVDRIAMWESRQPKREDNSADRVARHRANKNVTHGNADVTHGNAPEKIREDKKEEEHMSPSGDVARVFSHWQTVHGKQRSKLDPKRQRLIRNALKTYSADDLCRSIDGYKASPFHQGKNENGTVYDDLSVMIRDSKQVERGWSFVAKRAAPIGGGEVL